ncbi:hypothetical protein [Mucilaginibacter aquaedulcis]|uniref:hypothetical protein n=1 Tax=Mucilaginibacter aquaedulcis TaxID=1187081 RepID=UPI0025B2A73C|nr:hypothetical protein [Mucilaginibacter aquaedulcis]MDN3547231.1 hypothetical protein [Mucilaginibacter aquaedulcis]
MYIAYSALQSLSADNQQNKTDQSLHEPSVRYQAYLAACAKYSKEIADIQKFLPGWMPAFR